MCLYSAPGGEVSVELQARSLCLSVWRERVWWWLGCTLAHYCASLHRRLRKRQARSTAELLWGVVLAVDPRAEPLRDLWPIY